jgi:hypothetical protein
MLEGHTCHVMARAWCLTGEFDAWQSRNLEWFVKNAKA